MCRYTFFVISFVNIYVENRSEHTLRLMNFPSKHNQIVCQCINRNITSSNEQMKVCPAVGVYRTKSHKYCSSINETRMNMKIRAEIPLNDNFIPIFMDAKHHHQFYTYNICIHLKPYEVNKTPSHIQQHFIIINGDPFAVGGLIYRADSSHLIHQQQGNIVLL